MDWFEKSKFVGRFRSIHDEEKIRIFEFRDNPTPAEKALWKILRNNQINGLKFRRQHKIGQFIVDFYCHEIGLIIEADGNIHDNRKAEDRVRTEWLQTMGLKIIRFSNEEILKNLEDVKTRIYSLASISEAGGLVNPKGA
jgi:very-short-patch-repair endonuclease